MKYECLKCGKLVDENEVIVVTEHMPLTGTYFYFYCETCYKKTKEREKKPVKKKNCATCIYYGGGKRCNRNMTKIVSLDGCPDWSDKVEKE